MSDESLPHRCCCILMSPSFRTDYRHGKTRIPEICEHCHHLCVVWRFKNIKMYNHILKLYACQFELSLQRPYLLFFRHIYISSKSDFHQYDKCDTTWMQHHGQQLHVASIFTSPAALRRQQLYVARSFTCSFTWPAALCGQHLYVVSSFTSTAPLRRQQLHVARSFMCSFTWPAALRRQQLYADSSFTSTAALRCLC